MITGEPLIVGPWTYFAPHFAGDDEIVAYAVKIFEYVSHDCFAASLEIVVSAIDEVAPKINCAPNNLCAGLFFYEAVPMTTKPCS